LFGSAFCFLLLKNCLTRSSVRTIFLHIQHNFARDSWLNFMAVAAFLKLT